MSNNHEIPESLRERREVIFEMANVTKNKSGLPFDIWVDSLGKDRKTTHDSRRIKIKNSGQEIEISFYADPKIEVGEQNLKPFGESDMNTVIKYLKKHKALFLAHWNHDIDDGEIIMAMNIIRKNPAISDKDAIRQAKTLLS